MKKKHIPLVIGNWKMNPQTLEKAQSLVVDIKKNVGTKNVHAEVVVAPPFVFIAGVARTIQKTRISLGAQNVSIEPQGAHTGDVSLTMLKSLGVSYIIVGHSERREAGETDEQVAQKVAVVLQGGITAVVCVGEKVRDTQGDYFTHVETQVQALLHTVKKAHLTRLVIAYEPIWAIGTSQHATAEDVQEMKLFIQKIIADVLGRSAVSKIRIIYGGSVNKDNAEELLTLGNADGFLIGGASLKADEFVEIIKTSDVYGNKNS